jgi:hypothetical protein
VKHLKIPIVAAIVVTLVMASGGAGAMPDTRIAGTVEDCGGGALFLQHPHYTALEGSVLIWGARYGFNATESMRKGRFSFTVLPGRYTLKLMLGGGYTERNVDAAAHRTTGVEFDAGAARY